MTREEAINEINKVFTSAYANYIVTALTEGATVSDIQHRWGRAYEAGVKDGLEQEPCKDAVSVASVFEIMGNLMSIPYDFDRSITEKDVSESMDKIRALPRVTPQEPFINKPCVSSKVCEHDKHKVLDKIRAEMFEEMLSHSGTGEEVIQAYASGLKKGLYIIDRYKAESEGA